MSAMVTAKVDEGSYAIGNPALCSPSLNFPVPPSRRAKTSQCVRRLCVAGRDPVDDSCCCSRELRVQ